MVDFSELTPENINMFAMKHYDNPSCVDEAEFLDDLKRFKYLKRLFSRYDQEGDLKSRLILNHLIIFNNVFGMMPACRILFFKVEEKYYPILKTSLVFLDKLPTYIPEVDLDSIPLDHKILLELEKIYEQN